MPTEGRWSVDIVISEHGDRTRAEARLHAGEATELRGVGIVQCHPRDLDAPEVGARLAVARALGDLSRHLLGQAVGDIEALSVERADRGS